MQVLRWDRVGWEEFLEALEGYRAHFSGRNDEDFAYLRCLAQLRGRTMVERAVRARDIVTFLNAWHCRVKPLESRQMLANWVRRNVDRLDALDGFNLLDDRLPDAVAEMKALYDDLMVVGRDAVPNWSDAAASKALHQLIPDLFVMWDKNIKPYASGYGDFTLEMHAVGERLADACPEGPAEIEPYLQHRLGYKVRKTMAKYLDEYNWYVMVGGAQIYGP